MTDKGVPEKVWIRSIGNGNGGLYSTVDRSDSGPCTIFIRADIVEELVGVLGWYNDGRDPAASEVMSRIKAIMAGK